MKLHNTEAKQRYPNYAAVIFWLLLLGTTYFGFCCWEQLGKTKKFHMLTDASKVDLTVQTAETTIPK
jgi:membrane protein required for beta-lactamase induction